MISLPTEKGILMIGGYAKNHKWVSNLLELSGDSVETLEWRILEQKLQHPRSQLYWSFCRTFQLPRQSGNHFGFAAAMRQICGKNCLPYLRCNLATIVT